MKTSTTKTTAHTVHKTLHLQHHRHTGRVLHHKHTSYRGLAVVLVLATLCIVGLNSLARATADTIQVYASVPAPIPTQQATITSPANNAIVTNTQLIVTGTCPDITPRVLVVLLDNGTQVGSVPCDSTDTFSLTILIDIGRHTLIARTYTITGDTGPDSDPVDVFHVSPPSATINSTDNQTNNGVGLIVTVAEPFIVFGPGKEAIWLGSITGGTLPYRVHIDWGDGSSSTYTLTKAGDQHFTHRYHAMHPYTITLKVTDAAGRGAMQSYAAVTPYVPPAGLLTKPHLPWNGSLPLGVYGIYLLILAIFGGMWKTARPFAYAKVPTQRQPTPGTRKPKSTKH